MENKNKEEEIRLQRQEKRQLEKLIRTYTEKFMDGLEQRYCDKLMKLHSLYKATYGEEYKKR